MAGHRAAAAAELGLPVEIVEVAESDPITNHDIYDLPPVCLVRDVLEYGDWSAAAYHVAVT